MSCPTVDMESCDKKCKCFGGPCNGLAYDCADPCPGLYEEFNENTCSCDTTNKLGVWRWIGSITRFCGTSCISTQPNGTTIIDDAWWDINGNGVLIENLNEKPTIFGTDLICTYDLSVTSRCREVTGFESSFYMEKIGPCNSDADGIGGDKFRSPNLKIGKVSPGPDPNVCYASGFVAPGSTLRMTVAIGSYVEATGYWYWYSE